MIGLFKMSIGPGDESEDIVFQLGFEPLTIEDLPTGRLKDIMKHLEEKDPAVLTLDSLIFNASSRGDEKKQSLAMRVFQTFLYNIKPSVKTLSLRHNSFTPEAVEYFIDWIAQNDWIEILYIQGCNVDEKNKELLMNAWKKNLWSHRTDNFDNVFIRIVHDPNAGAEEDD